MSEKRWTGGLKELETRLKVDDGDDSFPKGRLERVIQSGDEVDDGVLSQLAQHTTGLVDSFAESFQKREAVYIIALLALGARSRKKSRTISNLRRELRSNGVPWLKSMIAGR